MMQSLPPADAVSLRRRLLKWFDRNARDLPWRRDRSVYAIWISEVMLQQTQVATVIPYFERFLRTFPDVASLARAEEQEVLRLWEGLGYYSRARNLHRAARILCAERHGQWPRTSKEAASLPGLGRYTVNAVLSQAFDARLPILEANSRRVLCRLTAETEDPRGKEADTRLWNMAEELLPRRRVGDFNQALMELGALVCTPDEPHCAACPVAAWCKARHQGLQDRLPVRAAAKDIEAVRELALIVEKGQRVFLCKRPPVGRWANLWEFPHQPWPQNETPEGAASALLAQVGLRAKAEGEWTVVRHGVTRFRISLHCWSARYEGGAFEPGLYADGRWVRPAELSDYPLSSPQRRLASLWTQPRQATLY